MVMEDGPMKGAVDAETENVLLQEFVTYSVRDGETVVKTVVTRTFSEGDYIDTTTVIPMGKVWHKG